MGLLGRRAVLAGAVAAVAAGPEAGVDVEIDRGRCLVPVSLDGRLARMLLDTGAERSVMAHAAALRLKLPSDQWVSTTLSGAGGQLERYANVDVRIARAGHIALIQDPALPGLSLPVTTADMQGADGLLGSDILRHFVVDLNMPAGRLALGTQSFTGGVALQAWRRDLLLAPVSIDGHMLQALVDTGSSASIINARGLFRMGLGGPGVLQGPASSVRAIGGSFSVQMHRFRAMRVGGLVIRDPSILGADVPQAGYDMILGLDVLGSQRLVLSYYALRMMFT